MSEYPWSMNTEDGAPDTSRFAQEYLFEKARTTLFAAALRHIINGTFQERARTIIPWRMTTDATPIRDIQHVGRFFGSPQNEPVCETNGLFYINAGTAALLQANINRDDLYGYRRTMFADNDMGAIMRVYARYNLPIPVIYDEGWIEHDPRPPQSRSQFKAFVPDGIALLLDRSLSHIIVLDVS